MKRRVERIHRLSVRYGREMEDCFRAVQKRMRGATKTKMIETAMKCFARSINERDAESTFVLSNVAPQQGDHAHTLHKQTAEHESADVFTVRSMVVAMCEQRLPDAAIGSVVAALLYRQTRQFHTRRSHTRRRRTE